MVWGPRGSVCWHSRWEPSGATPYPSFLSIRARAKGPGLGKKTTGETLKGTSRRGVEPSEAGSGGKSTARFFKAWGLPLTLGIPRTCPSGSGGLVWGSLHLRPWGLWLVLEPFLASVSPSVK